MGKIGIYSVSDRYIVFLRSDSRLQNVFDNKEGFRSHTRKYLGIVFMQDMHVCEATRMGRWRAEDSLRYLCICGFTREYEGQRITLGVLPQAVPTLIYDTGLLTLAQILPAG